MPHPLVTQTAQAAVLSATSNILAQGIEAYQNDVPLQLRLEPIIQFVIFAIISTPPNCLWQGYLEEKFPGQKPVVTPTKEKQDADVKTTLDVKNTVYKFVLDQTFGAVVNTLLFIGYVKGYNGGDGAAIIEAFKRESVPLWIAGLKVWPLVSIISFTAIPVESRILFGSAVGVLWGIYLSLLASKG